MNTVLLSLLLLSPQSLYQQHSEEVVTRSVTPAALHMMEQRDELALSMDHTLRLSIRNALKRQLTRPDLNYEKAEIRLAEHIASAANLQAGVSPK